MSGHNTNSSLENSADNALLNSTSTSGGGTGRRSPPTYVRDLTASSSESPSRERNIPIQISDQPAQHSPSPLTRTRAPVISPSSPTEREPFLPPASILDSSGQPRNNLTLVRDYDNEMTDADVALPDRTGWRYKLARATHISNPLLREGLAEFLGSFILIIFGNGAVAEVVLSAKTGAVNNFFSINIAYGLAVAFGVYIAGGVSGGHLNPAVSLGMAVLGKLQWRKVGIYFLAQYLGCFVASAVLYAIYADAFYAYDGGYRITNPAHPNATAGIFASYPQEHLTWGGGLVDQIFATSFLMIGILALTDERNTAPPKGVVPILVGLLVTAIGLSYGYNCGFPVNPARDLGPRLFTLVGGWGVEPFSFRNHNWFWIPVIGPHLGALLGVAVYQLFVGNQWPPLQRSGIELQVVRKNGLDEYELVKARDVRGSDLTVPVAISTKDGTTQRLLETR